METTSADQRVSPAPRRVATAPVSLPSSRQDVRDPGSLVETLYHHPNARIITFTASARALSVSPNRHGAGAVDEDEAGSLSWSSQLERTIAVGPVRIYRAPGSVAFLSCGSALQPILPKSQCWCIDEMNSRFVLQIRRPNYWRIELPVSDTQYDHLALQFREVLGRILQFEKTKCPFKRSFTVPLPEPPKTPIKKKPWKPVRQSLPNMTLDTAMPHPEPMVAKPTRRASTSQGSLHEDFSKLMSLTPFETDEGLTPTTEKTPSAAQLIPVWEAKITTHQESLPLEQSAQDKTLSAPVQQDREPQDIVALTAQPSEGFRPDDREPTPPLSEKRQPKPWSLSDLGFTKTLDNDASLDHQEEESGNFESSAKDANAADAGDLSYNVHEGSGSQRGRIKARLRRTAIFHSTRAALSNPDLSLVTDSSSPFPESATTLDDLGNISPTGSQDSFHSVQSWHSEIATLLPSPPVSHPDSPPRSGSTPEQDMVEDEDYGANELTPTIDRLTDRSSGTLLSHDSDRSSESITTAFSTSPVKVDNLPGRWISDDWPSASSAIDSQSTDTRYRAHARGAVQEQHNPSSSMSVMTEGPAADSMFSRTSLSRGGYETIRRLPLAIITRTCEILLGPPNYLMALMLKVAAKITAGEWSGRVLGYGEGGETIPVQWDYSEGDFSDWSDDDEPFMDASQRQPTPLSFTSNGDDETSDII